jgi:hypothetical protein
LCSLLLQSLWCTSNNNSWCTTRKVRSPLFSCHDLPPHPLPDVQLTCLLAGVAPAQYSRGPVIAFAQVGKHRHSIVLHMLEANKNICTC